MTNDSNGINLFKMHTLLLLVISVFLFSCQSKQKALPSDNMKPATSTINTSSKNTGSKVKDPIGEWNCEEPAFSYAGDQLIFWCTLPGFIKQQQVFIKDLNTNEVKQATFLNGRIKSPQIVKQDLIVFSSDTDRRKEILTLDQQIFESDSLFEIYMYDLRDDEMFQLSDNNYFDGSIEYLKHIDPKIVYVERKQNESFVVAKNLVNRSEKILYRTANKIEEISTNNSNTLLIIETVSGKKSLTFFKSEKEKITIPEIASSKFNFMFNAENQKLEYLETQNNNTLLKNFDPSNQCETTIYTFTNSKVSQLRKSPLDPQTYVWVEETNGMKNIKIGTLATSPNNTCNKLSLRNKKTSRL